MEDSNQEKPIHILGIGNQPVVRRAIEEMIARESGKKLKEKDPNKVANHTAIPNWSGYIYQGLCAAYVALRLCVEEPDKAQKYSLSLDSYEDFSIHDENDKIVGLHQCKCFGGRKDVLDFTGESDKMRIRKDNFVKNGECYENAPMFFHCNKDVNVGNDITIYEYHDKTTKLQPDEIESKIDNLLDEFNEGRKLLVAKDVFKRRLYFWIDQQVLKVHRKTMKGEDSAANVAKGEKLEISNVYQKLQTNGFEDLLSAEEVASYFRAYYLKEFEKEIIINDIIEEDNNLNALIKFREALINIPASELWNLFVRFNPHKQINNPFGAIAWGGDNAKSLFKVINKVNDIVNDKIQWIKNGMYETPVSFPSDRNYKKLCIEIDKNRINLNQLFDYKWLVGDVKESVPSVGEVAKKFKDEAVSTNGKNRPNERNKIFDPQNIGILSIKDKNDGNY